MSRERLRLLQRHRLGRRQLPVDDTLHNRQHIVEVLKADMRDAFPGAERVEVVIRTRFRLDEKHVGMPCGGDVYGTENGKERHT